MADPIGLTILIVLVVIVYLLAWVVAGRKQHAKAKADKLRLWHAEKRRSAQDVRFTYVPRYVPRWYAILCGAWWWFYLLDAFVVRLTKVQAWLTKKI